MAIFAYVQFANIEPKLNKLQKTIKVEQKLSKCLFSESFSKKFQFGLNPSSPNHQNIDQSHLSNLSGDITVFICIFHTFV